VGQKVLKQLYLWCHSQKNWNQQPKIFFSVQTPRLPTTCRIFWGFKQISSTNIGGDIPIQTHAKLVGILALA